MDSRSKDIEKIRELGIAIKKAIEADKYLIYESDTLYGKTKQDLINNLVFLTSELSNIKFILISEKSENPVKENLITKYAIQSDMSTKQFLGHFKDIKAQNPSFT
jgi:hypothetical protein